MSAERLLAHYERIAEAPDDIPRLRRFVLDLAVRGKLVPQDPNDEPASELLKQIAAEKARLVKAGEIKSQKPLPRVVAHELLVDLPRAWCCARLAEVALCLDYMREPINETEREKRIAGKPQEALYPYYGATQQQGWIDDYLFDEELLLLGEDGVPFFDPFRRKAYLISGKTWVNNHAHVFKGILISHAFLEHYLNVFDYSGRVVGATRSKLNQARAIDIPIPLPPLAEQRRIVAKVDELMALCDRLDAAHAEHETTRQRFTGASLARLNAPNPDTFHDDARFALEALPALTARPDQIKQLRQTILNLAVRGKLSPEGAWQAKPTKLREVASLQNGYAFKSEWFSRSGTCLLRNANIGHGQLNWDEEVRLPESRVPEYERFRLREGDVVLSLDRPFIVTGTKVARVKAHDLPALLLQRVGRFVLTPAMHPDYLFLWINSPHFSEQIDPGRSNGVPHVSSKQVEDAVIFVPPLAEQRRIVAKLDEMMALCERLEASLTTSDETRRRLLDALLAEALAPDTVGKLEAAE
jgi:type I restriction enzyme S subunit